MSGSGTRMLLLGKASHELCARAAQFLTTHAPGTVVHLGRRGEARPAIPDDAEFDYLISYLSPWIVPTSWLARAKIAAINFHPGPPEYPGIGCTNFAIYEGAAVYGVTCHHMERVPDTGPIVRTVRFPVYHTDTALSLTQRCYAYLGRLFYEIADLIISGQPLPASSEGWTRRPFRRAELNALCRLAPDMSPDEVRRRVRATTFPGHPSASLGALAAVRQGPE